MLFYVILPRKVIQGLSQLWSDICMHTRVYNYCLHAYMLRCPLCTRKTVCCCNSTNFYVRVVNWNAASAECRSTMNMMTSDPRRVWPRGLIHYQFSPLISKWLPKRVDNLCGCFVVVMCLFVSVVCIYVLCIATWACTKPRLIS